MTFHKTRPTAKPLHWLCNPGTMRLQTAILLLATTPVFAQQRDETTQPASDPAPIETAEEIARRMFADGSSLLQAQLNARPQLRGEAPLAVGPGVSFWAVPPPEPTLVRQHDLLTIIVREESSSRSAGSGEYEKEYSLAAELREYVDLDIGNLRVVPKRGGQAIDFEAERQFSGDGKSDRRDSFVTRITAEVLDVKPNGTLVIQARKRITTDDDEALIVLTGTCRTADVTAGNTVLSTQLHDLHLQKHTSGPVRDASRRGFLPRIIDRVNPF